MDYQFPIDFLWGTAMAAYQVDGNNRNSDWWPIEKEIESEIAESNGADHYNRFREDYALASDLSLNAQRLSLEWSRIEPEEGVFDEKEIVHYREVLRFLKDKNVKVFLTLHHFSNPLWFEGKGGWLDAEGAKKYFGRFVELCVKEFSSFVDAFIIINEPNLYSGFYPLQSSQGQSSIRTVLVKDDPSEETSENKIGSSSTNLFKVYSNLLNVHRDVYLRIKKLNPAVPVGPSINFQCFDFFNRNFLNKAAAYAVDFLNDWFLKDVLSNYADFIGVNYYFHLKVKINPLNPRNFIEFYNGNAVMTSWGIIGTAVHFNLSSINKGAGFSDIGWETHPEGLFRVLMNLKKYRKPIYVTENGLSDGADGKRESYIKEHLYQVWKAVREGTDVRGYFYWSLIDNFEWFQGYKTRFGLAEVDYKTKERKVRPSAHFLAKTARANSLEF